VPRPFSWGRDQWQTCLQKVCPGEDLLQPVAELQEAVRRLRNIREAEEVLDSWFQAQSAVDLQPTAKQQKNSHAGTHRREGVQ